MAAAMSAAMIVAIAAIDSVGKGCAI
jgi:hypothetical protein